MNVKADLSIKSQFCTTELFLVFTDLTSLNRFCPAIHVCTMNPDTGEKGNSLNAAPLMAQHVPLQYMSCITLKLSSAEVTFIREWSLFTAGGGGGGKGGGTQNCGARFCPRDSGPMVLHYAYR